MSDRRYHQFLGNGIDALLLGPTGAMVPDAAEGLDRCYWYKADLYYPDTRVFAHGHNPAAFLASPPGGTNYQLAPLARIWYEVLDAAGEPLHAAHPEQRFDSETGALHTGVSFGDRRVLMRSWLAPDRPAIHFDLQAPDTLIVRAHAAPGLWSEDIEQTEPASAIDPIPDSRAALTFAVGDERCALYLVSTTDPSACEAGTDARGAWIRMRGAHLHWWAVLESSRYPEESGTNAHLPAEPVSTAPSLLPHLEIPDAEYTRMHSFSMYMFRAMQHRHSGGLPVNNLRRTFNSHVFWDGAFVQRALLETGHVCEARAAWRFLAHTRESAAANAIATFGASGLHWDWEITHTGKRAYIPWLQQRFQIHNTPLLAHMILADFRATRDRAVLVEGYDLLKGAAEFILQAALADEGAHLDTRPLVGSHEAAERVVNDGATVAACLRLLTDVAVAARLLRRDDPLARGAANAAFRLRSTLGNLYNGRYFQASRDEDRLNTSSLTPIYPADVLKATDPRAVTTAAAYRARYAGRMAGHGNGEDGFPWSAGMLARILAYQGKTAAAWEQLQFSRAALCAQGGCAEYVGADGRWNNQYFSTAQAALCSALHALLVQEHGSELRLFPALPPGWDHCAFRGFLFGGIRLDAEYGARRARVVVSNETDHSRRFTLRVGSNTQVLALESGGRQELEMEERDGQRGI